MADPKTIAVYDARAAEYATGNARDEPWHMLVSFRDAMPAGGRVLDLGCGPGASAGHFAQHGLQVDAWDASAEMVALAAQVDGVTAKQAVFADLDVRDLYDGIWANFSLLHAPRADMSAHLAAIRAALKPGGLFHIALKEGENAARDSIGRQYTYYTMEELTGLLLDAGLQPGDFTTGEEEGLDGTMARWIATQARAI